jgi:hypothetical protein
VSRYYVVIISQFCLTRSQKFVIMYLLEREPNKEEKMETIRLYTFYVRKGFGPYKEKDVFRASIRTYVLDMKEIQDFNFEDGTAINAVPCEYTKFKE